MSSRRSWLGFELTLLRRSPREWLVLTGDRRLVTALGLFALLVTFLGVAFLDLTPLRKETPLLFLLFALIAANFTLISIVTSLSQFVLSRRLETPGEVRRKMAETVEYREDVGAATGNRVMPVKPDSFFLLLFESADETLETLSNRVEEGRTKRAREELEALTAGLGTHVEYVSDLLDDPASSLKHALFVSLNTEYERHVHRAWYLQAEHAGEFTERATEPLETLTQTLQHIVVASRMFRSSFIQSEVAELSRFLFYVGPPVQLVMVVVLLLYTAPGSEPPLALSTLRVLIPAVLTAGFAPFVMLSAYVVRLTIVAHRTAETFPFSSRLENTLALDDSPLWEK